MKFITTKKLRLIGCVAILLLSCLAGTLPVAASEQQELNTYDILEVPQPEPTYVPSEEQITAALNRQERIIEAYAANPNHSDSSYRESDVVIDMDINPSSSRTLIRPGYISPASQSAPYAYGKIYYLYVFVDFEYPGLDGNWNSNDRNTAETDAYLGTHAIKNRAPSNAYVTNDGGAYSVQVSGSYARGTGAYGVNGWMERAFSELGFHSTDGNQFISDDVARYFKSQTNADSVVIIYFIHDFGSSFAVATAEYADRAAVLFYTLSPASADRDPAIPATYQHEALHLLGAIDEYNGSSGPNHYSEFAVSPMNRYYRNTNHVNDQINHTLPSVMRQHRDTQYISISTQRFIGWGDHDNDGILDPFDTLPDQPMY